MSIIPASWMPRVHMERIICHWTAGGYAVSAIDREHYHVIIGGDGQPVRGDKPISANAAPIKGAYAAHTLHCNTGSIGISLACMAGAIERPFSAGPAPMKRVQWDTLVQAVAELCRAYGIPVTPRTVLSHAEVQVTLGIQQRGKWDIARIAFDPGTVGAKACGDRLRREVAAVLAFKVRPSEADIGEAAVSDNPTLRIGDDGEAVRLWQVELQREGFAVKLDGDFGPSTDKATRTLQARLGVTADGVVGPGTRLVLEVRRAKPIPTSTHMPRLAAFQEPASMSTASAINAAVTEAVTAAAADPDIAVQRSAVPAITAAVTAEVGPIVDHLTNNEPWYQSRVTWGAIISAVVPILGAFGIATDWIKPDEVAAIIVAVGAALGTATTLYGRWKARKPIGA